MQKCISSLNVGFTVSESMMEAVRSASKAFQKLNRNISPMIASLSKLSVNMPKLIPTEFMKNFSAALSRIQNDPDSIYNYYQYERQLNNFHWAWPYDIDTNELKSLIESVHSEKEFDSYMNKYFSKEKIILLQKDLDERMPVHHKVLFRQIVNAFNNHDYAIANNAMLSILDNLLSIYLDNKGMMRREGIYVPIIEFTREFHLVDSGFRFRLIMLEHNIDFIFQSFNLGNSISLESNKQIRRHPALHGFKFSNKKTDSLMLLNTISEVLIANESLELFYGSLWYKKKQFEMIETKKRRIIRKIIKWYIIKGLKENHLSGGEGMTHKQIVEYLNESISPDLTINLHKEVSNALQAIKKSSNSPIKSIREGSAVLWVYISDNAK